MIDPATIGILVGILLPLLKGLDLGINKVLKKVGLKSSCTVEAINQTQPQEQQQDKNDIVIDQEESKHHL